jgi:serine/threonine protein kinase
MQCPNCHLDNPEGSKFCKECGTQITPLAKGQPSFTKTLASPREKLTTGLLFVERYEIIEVLGRGGMGEVYRALDTQINEEVAIKLIKPEIAQHEDILERFSNELKLSRKISHKHVCRMYHLEKKDETSNRKVSCRQQTPLHLPSRSVRGSSERTIWESYTGI